MSREAIRMGLPLGAGLLIGVAGAVLFRGSLPGEAGSPEERIAKLESELKVTRNENLALRSEGRSGRRELGSKDRFRDIARDIRDGKPVTPDDLLRASQPLMRDFAPLIDRVRIRQEREMADAMAGEFSRRYGLDANQRDVLRKWMEDRAEVRAREWTELVSRDGTTLEDLIRASSGKRVDEALDPVMERMLSGQKLAQFREQRMTERVTRVQEEADRRMERIDRIVTLDDTQRDAVFGIFARSSKHYDPAMRIEGGTGAVGQSSASGGDPMASVMGVLTAEQREAFRVERESRRAEAAAELAKVGLALPADWDPLEWEDFD